MSASKNRRMLEEIRLRQAKRDHVSCCLCGIGPEDQAPWHFVDAVSITKELRPIAAELQTQGIADGMSAASLLGILRAGCEETCEYYQSLTFLQQYCKTYVGIGYWNREGLFKGSLNDLRVPGSTPNSENSRLIPDGKLVEMRRMSNVHSHGVFQNILQKSIWNDEMVPAQCITDCRPEHTPSVLLCERCFRYLTAWLSIGGCPDRSYAFPQDPAPLTLAGELYEIVHSRHLKRNNRGMLPEIGYDGHEVPFDRAKRTVTVPIFTTKGTQSTASAIDSGLRGTELIPAIMRDSGSWMYVKPNRWPFPPKEIEVPQFTAVASGAESILESLPYELLPPLLSHLPLASLLAFSATCRSLRNLITDPSFLDEILREAILCGSLQWIGPVSTPSEPEHEDARDCFFTWLYHGRANGPFEEAKEVGYSVDPATILTIRTFPRLAFLRACWESHSMMNRKRLWGQVKRFEVLWRDYRTNGWQDPVFYPSKEYGSDVQQT